MPLNYDDWLGQALLLIGLCGRVGRVAGSWEWDVVEGVGDGGGRGGVNAFGMMLSLPYAPQFFADHAS